ncbi:hypothetical protein H4582DRAFT_2129735 [Lactarius indigo]|nr:hypothetical protein H4582DRAFT_2129735 [Lactarius indigo]
MLQYITACQIRDDSNVLKYTIETSCIAALPRGANPLEILILEFFKGFQPDDQEIYTEIHTEIHTDSDNVASEPVLAEVSRQPAKPADAGTFSSPRTPIDIAYRSSPTLVDQLNRNSGRTRDSVLRGQHCHRIHGYPMVEEMTEAGSRKLPTTCCSAFVLIEAKEQPLKDYVANGSSFSYRTTSRQNIALAIRSHIGSRSLLRLMRSRYIRHHGDGEGVGGGMPSAMHGIATLSRSGVKIGKAMKEMHASILKAHNNFEHQSIEDLVGDARRF